MLLRNAIRPLFTFAQRQAKHAAVAGQRSYRDMKELGNRARSYVAAHSTSGSGADSPCAIILANLRRERMALTS